ncbi:hypothetical protein CYMTET_49569 [Cymbomonas tetramitiformis]|uniref:Uncharacterized protein n=1 Tax=Cymbomonas tetramitiformis TaxID=36881 RepID=A0AAE0BQ12_9CHLO|nr:hypothetical protein CYMTET_49569 [Cymbomonas tetramitiformis]
MAFLLAGVPVSWHLRAARQAAAQPAGPITWRHVRDAGGCATPSAAAYGPKAQGQATQALLRAGGAGLAAGDGGKVALAHGCDVG